MRRMTVSTRWTGKRDVPHVRLSGDWLTKLGFAPGTRFAVQAITGRLILTAETTK